MEPNSETPSSQNSPETPRLTDRVDEWAKEVDQLINQSQPLVNFGNKVTERLVSAATGSQIGLKRMAQATAVAGAITLFTACGNPAFAETPMATPTPIIVESTGGSQSKVTIKSVKTLPETEEQATKQPAEEIPTFSTSQPVKQPESPAPLPIAEKETARQLAVNGYLETDPNDPSLEKIHLIFPKGILDGESPIVPQGNSLSFAFNLDSGLPITRVKFPISEWLSDFPGGLAITRDDATEPSTGVMPKDFLLQKVEEEGVSIENPEVLDGMRVLYGTLPDGKFRLMLEFPNENLIYTDSRGSHMVNPAEQFLSNPAFSIGRKGELPPGTAMGPASLRVEGFGLSGEPEVLFEAPDFDINPPEVRKIVVESEAGQPKSPSGPTKNELPPQQAQEQEENRWKRDWQPNETVPLREWWNDMISKGYVQIDSLARQLKGEKIDGFINGMNLVPNPQEYHQTGLGFQGNCATELKRLAEEGQGHVKVDNRAFDNIPGGADNCQVFANRKSE